MDYSDASLVYVLRALSTTNLPGWRDMLWTKTLTYCKNLKLWTYKVLLYWALLVIAVNNFKSFTFHFKQLNYWVRYSWF